MHLRTRADAVSVGSTHEASRWMCISSCDQWNLTPATMCGGSAARALYEAETLEQQTMHLHKCDHVFFYLGKKSGGGGVVRLTAKPRYLLLLHRGEKKSNTVTALDVWLGDWSTCSVDYIHWWWLFLNVLFVIKYICLMNVSGQKRCCFL